MYECGTLKPVEIILKGSEGRGRVMEGMNQTWYRICIYGMSQ
jgi:hypothetical protein